MTTLDPRETLQDIRHRIDTADWATSASQVGHILIAVGQLADLIEQLLDTQAVEPSKPADLVTEDTPPITERHGIMDAREKARICAALHDSFVYHCKESQADEDWRRPDGELTNAAIAAAAMGAFADRRDTVHTTWEFSRSRHLLMHWVGRYQDRYWVESGSVVFEVWDRGQVARTHLRAGFTPAQFYKTLLAFITANREPSTVTVH